MLVVDEMLKLARVGPNDFVVDLGSGDGRLVLTAVTKFGARGGFGVDIDASLVDYANRKALEAGVYERARFHVRDLFVTDIHEATVVTVYLLPIAMNRLQAKLLAELAPGSRVVSHDYPFRSWPADRVVALDVPEKSDYTGRRSTAIYLYRCRRARRAGSCRDESAGAAGRGRTAPRCADRDAMAIIVGIVIGAGIYRTPALVAEVAGDGGWTLAMWLAGAVISFIGALCYAELASTYPHAGGDYHFLTRAFGRDVSFLYGWARATVINPGSIALLAFVFGDYLSRLLLLGPHSAAVWAALLP